MSLKTMQCPVCDNYTVVGEYCEACGAALPVLGYECCDECECKPKELKDWQWEAAKKIVEWQMHNED